VRSHPALPRLRRFLAALLIVAFPAMALGMALPGPAGHAMSAHAAHAGHHAGTGGPHHSPDHRQCCDFCGTACGCSVHFASLRVPPSAAVLIVPALAPASRSDRLTSRVAHLHPLALGPPLRSA
jgi:hypothetical protein